MTSRCSAPGQPPRAGLCTGQQRHAGTPLAEAVAAMSNIFSIGADLVRWEVTALGGDGPYRLTLLHPRGTLVEYFQSATAALLREAELELLMTAAAAGPVPAGAAL